MKTKAIHEASYPDLLRFAAESGLDVTYGKTKLADVRRLVSDAFGSDFEIPVGEAAAEPVVEVLPASKLTSHYRDDPKVTVNIASDPLTGGSHPFPICCNGDHILVKRDTDVEIPYRFYEVLKNAKEIVGRQEFDAAGRKYITIETEQDAVRYSAKRLPSDEEVAAFHERTKDLNREEPKKLAA